MAIVQTIEYGNGITVYIDDSCAVSRDSEEGQKIVEEQQRAAYRILAAWAEAQEEGEAGCG